MECPNLHVTISNATDSRLIVGFQNSYPEANTDGAVFHPRGAATAENVLPSRSRRAFRLIPDDSNLIVMFIIRAKGSSAIQSLSTATLLSTPISQFSSPNMSDDADFLYQAFRFAPDSCSLAVYPGTTSTENISVTQVEMETEAIGEGIEFVVRDGPTSENAEVQRGWFLAALIIGCVSVFAMLALAFKVKVHGNHPLHPKFGQTRRAEWGIPEFIH